MKDTFLNDLRRASLYRAPRLMFDMLLGLTLVAVLISGGAQITSAFAAGKKWIDGVNAIASNLVGLMLVLLVRYLVCVMFDLVDVSALKARSEPIQPPVPTRGNGT